MTELTLEILRAELAPLRADLAIVKAALARIEPSVDGIPLIHRAIDALQRDQRALKAAFNDFAKTNVTSGEVEALHDDVDKALSNDRTLENRILTLERLVRELQKNGGQTS
jgi:hypothetical protein